MHDAAHDLSRRSLIKGAGLGLGLLAAAPSPAAGHPTAAGPIWSAEYWAKKGDVSLNLFRKRAGRPQAEEPPRPVLFLVHGSSISARPSFDLAVPGSGAEYSLMNVFSAWGFDVWTMDHEGYGRSSRTDGNSDIASGVEDLKAAGTYLDMTANLPVVDPARVQAPVLLVGGEHDGIATEEDLLDFGRRLSCGRAGPHPQSALARHARVPRYARARHTHLLRRRSWDC